MTCSPLSFSTLTVKVMRDGDGDGRCQEEDGKWVPCPPGVASGSRLRNGKPLGETISEIATAPAKASAKTPAKQPVADGPRQIEDDELQWFDDTEIPSFSEWDQLFGERFEPPVSTDRNAPGHWAAISARQLRLHKEYKRLQKEAAQRRREQRVKNIRENDPDFFDEFGNVNPEIVEEYLNRQRAAAQRFADKAESAADQVTPESRRAARNLGPFWRRVLGPSEDELSELYEREWPRPERSDYDDDEDGADAWQSDLDTWEWERDDWVYTELQDRKGISRELESNIRTAFEHTFTGKSGRTYQVELYEIESDPSDQRVKILGRIVTRDNNGRPRAVADFHREFGPDYDGDGDAAYHESLTVDEFFQGDGIATSFNAMNEQIYRDIGLDKIKVTGASGGTYNGASHWPANGFNWTPYSKNSFLNHVEEALDEQSPDFFANDAEREILRALIDAASVQDPNFDDDLITAGDLIRWKGATEYFKRKGITISYVRWLD